ncbi:hypothetical protein ACLB2K_073966 [Fragaria x ananassa]
MGKLEGAVQPELKIEVPENGGGEANTMAIDGEYQNEEELDWESVASGLLHDTVEDTNVVTFERIEEEFGATVHHIVEGETKVSKLGKLKCKGEHDFVQDVKAYDLRQMLLAMTEESSITRETLQVFAPLAKLLGIDVPNQDCGRSYTESQRGLDVIDTFGMVMNLLQEIGLDTRKTFTDHLYTALVNAGIRTFRDDNELERGQDIKPELEKAIQLSRGSVIVFSKDYASCGWCLDELVMILEQKRTSDHVVLPVFYDIDPTHVRKQTGSVAKALARHGIKAIAGEDA